MTAGRRLVVCVSLISSKLWDRILVALLETVDGPVRFLRDRAGKVALSHSITIASKLCCTLSSDIKEDKKVAIVKSRVFLL
jgi:hypothetical protein